MRAALTAFLAPRDHLKLQARCFEDLGQTAELWVSGLRKRPAERDSVHAGLARHGGHATPRFGNVAQRQHERRLVAFAEGSVQIGDAKLRVAELLGEPLTLVFRRQVSSALHNLSS